MAAETGVETLFLGDVTAGQSIACCVMRLHNNPEITLAPILLTMINGSSKK